MKRTILTIALILSTVGGASANGYGHGHGGYRNADPRIEFRGNRHARFFHHGVRNRWLTGRDHVFHRRDFERRAYLHRQHGHPRFW